MGKTVDRIITLFKILSGFGGCLKGYHVTSLQEALIRGLKTRANDTSANVKFAALQRKYMHDTYHGVLYSKAQNLVLELSRAYDEVLKKVDVLIMPTCPTKAKLLPRDGISIKGEASKFSVWKTKSYFDF